MFQAVVDSIFEPGVNNQLLAAVNVVFVCLVLVIVAMFLLVGFNLHLLFMLLLSTGLLLSVNWFLREAMLKYDDLNLFHETLLDCKRFVYELSRAKQIPESEEKNKDK